MRINEYKVDDLKLVVSADEFVGVVPVDARVHLPMKYGHAFLSITGYVDMGKVPSFPEPAAPREVNKVMYEVGDCKLSIESGESVADIIAAATNGVPSSIDNQITINGNLTMNGGLSDVAAAIARDLHKHTGDPEMVDASLPADNAPGIATWKSMDDAVALLPAYLREPIDQIDAAVFSGDPFDGRQNGDCFTRMALMTFLNRWARALQEKHKDALAADPDGKESLG